MNELEICTAAFKLAAWEAWSTTQSKPYVAGFIVIASYAIGVLMGAFFGSRRR